MEEKKTDKKEKLGKRKKEKTSKYKTTVFAIYKDDIYWNKISRKKDRPPC